jgi:orotate phosphoribosyltransferase
MNRFERIYADIDVAAVSEELRRSSGWQAASEVRSRAEFPDNTEAIVLRGACQREDIALANNQEEELTDKAAEFSATLCMLTRWAEAREAILARVVMIRWPGHSGICRQLESGAYTLIRNRYHFVIDSVVPGAFSIGREQVRMRVGEVWRVDHRQGYETFNEGGRSRVHCVFDMLPIAYKDLAVNPTRKDIDIECQSRPNREPVPSEFRRGTLRRQIAERAILRGHQQSLIGPNGRRNRWLIDIRRIALDSRVLEAVSEQFWIEHRDIGAFQVVGMEVAAIPFLAAIVSRFAREGVVLNAVIIRKERKTYGTCGTMEGVLTDAPIVVVDDVINSGRSVEKVRAVLEKEGRAIRSVFVLIDYKSAQRFALMKHWTFNVTSIFDLKDFGLSLLRRKKPAQVAKFVTDWRFAVPGASCFHLVPKSFPATQDGRIYFGSDSGSLWCLQTTNGEVAWKFETRGSGKKGIWSSPAIAGSSVVFGAYNGSVYSLNSVTGREQWCFREAEWVGSSPAVAPELGLVYVGLEFSLEGKKGSVAAVDLNSGDRMWEYRTRRYTHASPIYLAEKGLVACGSNDDELLLLDGHTGKLVWRFQTRGIPGGKGSIRHAPAFDARRQHLISGCADGRIYVIDLSTGTEVWSVQTGGEVYTVPLVVDDLAFVGSTDKNLYVLDLRARRVRRKLALGTKIMGPPRCLNGRVYFGACNGLVYEMDPGDGRVTGWHQLPDAVTNALCYDHATGRLFALTYANELFAFSRA